MLTSSVAAALVVVVAIAGIAIVRHGNNGRVRVAGAASKEVPATEMNHVDVIVVPASTAVQTALDASPLVARYALMPKGAREALDYLASPPPLRAPLCALESNAGFAVDMVTPGSAARSALAQAIPATATVYDVSDDLGFDIEVFMRVGATPAQANNVRRTLASDPAVGSFQDITQADAYAIFKRDFADQPSLVGSTKPSDLPESFRVDPKAGASLPALSQRYDRLVGVDTVIRPVAGQIFVPLTPAQLRLIKPSANACPAP